MVSEGRASVWSVLVALLAWAGPAAAQGGAGPAGKPEQSPVQRVVEDALRQGNYPWYDAPSDSVKPLWPPQAWDWEWLRRWFRWLKLDWVGRLRFGWLPASGRLVAIVLSATALVALLGFLALLWQRQRPVGDALLAAARGPGMAARVESLPAGLRPETDDPWSEALRCRARGDFARAVVCLFAHQLLTLDRLRQVRLLPGRTARQLVRAINDRQLRGWVDPTLRLFEAVYYGHRTPTAEAFEPVWSAAEAFERRIAEGAAS